MKRYSPSLAFGTLSPKKNLGERVGVRGHLLRDSTKIIAVLKRRPANWKYTLVVLALAFSSTGAGAHDFWIEPDNFRPQAGEPVAMHLYVGQDFKGNSLPYLPDWIERYVFIGPDSKETPVSAIVGDDPAGKIPVADPGLYVIGYRSTRFTVDLTLEKFEAYLMQEGLERILPLYRERSAGKTSVHETFSRCAKALISAGTPARPVSDRALGMRLELIAERNPYLPLERDELPVRLFYENKPLAGALIIASNKADATNKLKVRSDRNGRAVLTLTRPGVWLVTAVHIIVPPPDVKTDWESFWASLSFELPP
jgi:uncharacterized GH25 family protein